MKVHRGCCNSNFFKLEIETILKADRKKPTLHAEEQRLRRGAAVSASAEGGRGAGHVMHWRAHGMPTAAGSTAGRAASARHRQSGVNRAFNGGHTLEP